MSDMGLKMFKYLLFLQVLFATELCGWQDFHMGKHLGGYLRITDYEDFNTTNIEGHWLIQSLNHSDPTDQRKWKQRYFVNDKYYQNSTGGPVFLMIGGQRPADKRMMRLGAWMSYAKQYGALCFLLEHRFYGESYPTEDVSVDNMQYLTSQQALADLATFIVAMNKKYHLPSDVKWIAFGGFYGGSLAAWLRLKYPHLVHGAVSSSAPLLAKVDFKDYYKVVAESLGTYSNECVDAVKDGFAEIDLLFQNSSGQQKIANLFKLCHPLEFTPNDISNFYQILAGWFDFSVISNKSKDSTISFACNIMTRQSLGAPMNRLAHFVRTFNPMGCRSYRYVEKINYLKDDRWLNQYTMIGARQWLYQSCSEFGFYSTSSQSPNVFGNGFPVNFFVQHCTDLFGPAFNLNSLNSAANNTNKMYGGVNINVTNVVFVHGSLDPWHTLGVVKNISSESPAIFIKGASHCADMDSESSGDSPELKAARKEIVKYIDTWLKHIFLRNNKSNKV